MDIRTQTQSDSRILNNICLDEIDPSPYYPFNIKDDEEMNDLIKSIEMYGMLTPGVVRQKEGGRFELVSGHRRFKAYASVAMGKDYYTDADLEELYTDAFDEKYNEWKNRPIDLNNIFSEEETSWFEIPAKIISDENEDAVYNDSNTTQREITAFEIIDNSMDEMKNNGTWEQLIEKIKSERVNSMTDRAVRDNVKNLIANGILEEPSSKKIEELRAVLLNVDAKYTNYNLIDL